MRRRSAPKIALPLAVAIAAGVILAGAAEIGMALAQHTSGGHSGGHSGSLHVDHGSGHGGQRGGGHGGRHGDGHGDGHGGGAGVGHADLEDKIFRRGALGRAGRLEDMIFRQGQRPVWAGGAVPEDLELGRLNVARAPYRVRANALQEVYSSNLDKDGDGVIDADADLGAVDSPVANLALYEQALKGGGWTLAQAAQFLGRASDKTIPIAVATVDAVNLILGISADEAGISDFVYDRGAAYSAALVDAVFGGQGYVGSGLAAFAQAADDERAVTLHLHDNPQTMPGS